MWVKWVYHCAVGTGDYEAPEMKDVKQLNFGTVNDSTLAKNETDNTIWKLYKNDTGKELPEASVRCMEIDKDGNLWVGTNNAGVAIKTPQGSWKNLTKITTDNAGEVTVDISYAIVQRENGELWMALEEPKLPRNTG